VFKARVIVAAVVLEGRSQSEVARYYHISQSTVSRYVARFRHEGEEAFEPRSRRPKHSPNAIPPETVDLILLERRRLIDQGLDAGPDTIAWHLLHNHQVHVSATTISRYLTRNHLVTPEPKKRPKTAYIRFQAELPNQCWQADFTHYPLTRPDGRPGHDTEILTWLDDCSRYALRVTAHLAVTGPLVLRSFRQAVEIYGIPSSTLTDNGNVFTTRLTGGKGGLNALETELRGLGVQQKNSHPNHPTTCGKVERFQQTLKSWLRAQPFQPTSLEQLQALLDTFVSLYNHQRPHRSLPHRATPAVTYHTLPKASPADHHGDPHWRIRHDIIDDTGSVTLRIAGRLLHIGVGRPYARTHVVLLVYDLDVRVIDVHTGELLRALTLDLSHTYQGTGRPPGPWRRTPDN